MVSVWSIQKHQCLRILIFSNTYMLYSQLVWEGLGLGGGPPVGNWSRYHLHLQVFPLYPSNILGSSFDWAFSSLWRSKLLELSVCIDNVLILTPPPKQRKETEYSKGEVLGTHLYCKPTFFIMLLLLLLALISEAELPYFIFSVLIFGFIILYCSFLATY